MRMLIARAAGVVCALMISGCALVEQIGALTTQDSGAPVPTLSELESRGDWTNPEDLKKASAKNGQNRKAAGDAVAANAAFEAARLVTSQSH